MWAGMESGRTSSQDLFFIGISPKFFLYLFLSFFFDRRIYILDTSANRATTITLQKLHEYQYIIRILEHNHAFYDSHSIAIDLANKAIDKNINDTVIQLVKKICKGLEVELVFKRVLVQHLSFLTSINQYIVHNEQVRHPVLFLEKKYCGVLQDNPELLDSSVVIRHEVSYWSWIGLWLTWLTVSFGYLLHLMMQFFYKKRDTQKEFKYAVSIPFPWAAKFKGARKFTFLVDDKIIKKDETVFLVEYRESQELYQSYSNDGYNLTEAVGIQKISNLFAKSTLSFHDDFFKVVKLLIAHKRDYFAYEALISLLFYRISWSVITSQAPFRNYIYFNKEGKSQNATNIFLKEKKIVTHSYSQFIGGPYQMCGIDSILDERNIHYSFLNPDYYYLNNQAMMDSMILHCQELVKHRVIGNIFSEKIIELKRDPQYVGKLKNQFNIESDQKVVGIFDTTYLEVGKHYSTYNEAQNFLEDVIRLAESMPQRRFLFKPSKSEVYFLKGYWSSQKGIRVIQLRHKFEQLDNATMLLDSDDVIDVITVSDVVLTNSFSSPTTDALLADIPAFWYQAKTDVSFSIYNKIPNLVVTGYDNLIIQVDSMLQDEQLEGFSNKPCFSYLIGDRSKKALTFLRLSLAN